MLAAMAAMMVALPSAAFPCIGEHRSGASSAGSESRATTQSECGCCCAQESDATPRPGRGAVFEELLRQRSLRLSAELSVAVWRRQAAVSAG
jgi:hypothetical protein